MRLLVTWKDAPSISCCNLHQRNYGEVTPATLRVFAQDVAEQGEPELIEVFSSDPTIPTDSNERSEWVR